MKQCCNCRWWFRLDVVHEKTEWANCLALPYPTCMETMVHHDAECIVPDKYSPYEDGHHAREPNR